MMKCKYCDNDGYYFVLSTGKIRRYGMYCDKCHRMIKWVPNVEAEHICKDDIREEVGEKTVL